MTQQERDAWADIYRLYDEFAPGLRAAAAMDDDNVTAGNLFCSALEKMRLKFDGQSPEGQLLILAGYDILDQVFKDAQKRAKYRAEAEGRENPPPSPGGA